MAKKTYERVVELLNEHIPVKVSRNEFCRVTGINRNSVDRYMAGIGEPSSATLKKLAEYFKVPVIWLLGELKVSYDFLQQTNQMEIDPNMENTISQMIDENTKGLTEEEKLKFITEEANFNFTFLKIINNFVGLAINDKRFFIECLLSYDSFSSRHKQIFKQRLFGIFKKEQTDNPL